MRVTTLTILILTIGMLISTSLVLASYNRMNGNGELRNSISNGMMNHHGSMRMTHYNETAHAECDNSVSMSDETTGYYESMHAVHHNETASGQERHMNPKSGCH